MKYPIVEESRILYGNNQEFSENQPLAIPNLSAKRKAAKP